jgi:hypothetical protein
MPSYITRRTASLSLRWCSGSGARTDEMAEARIIPLIAFAVPSTSTVSAHREAVSFPLEHYTYASTGSRASVARPGRDTAR